MTGFAAPRAALALAAGGLVALALAAPAEGQTATSSNWSGYAAHSSHVDFRTVSGTWREPAATCTSGTETEAAFWVGIGGYSSSSTAMEQIGTELDCGADGSVSLSAWYELVPAASHTIHLTVAPGDLISARVTVVGRQVMLGLTDRTRGESFRRTIVASSVDTTSAEWIAEAPSDCTSSGDCTIAALTDFGAVAFSSTSARTTGGIGGDISDSAWTTTRLLLGYTTQNRQFVARSSSASATPSALASGGRSFSVAYAAPTTADGTGSGGNGGGFGSPGSGPGPGGPP